MIMDLSPEMIVILKSLEKEREAAYAQVKEYDRIIKRIKSGDYSFMQPTQQPKVCSSLVDMIPEDSILKPQFPLKADIKVQILTIVETIGMACKLKDIQDEFKRLTGSLASIRESVRTLNKAGKLLMMKEKNALRGNYWVKAEWVENGRLLDKYKFDGFSLLYDDDNLLFLQGGEEQQTPLHADWG
jgi:hypothetical protein